MEPDKTDQELFDEHVNQTGKLVLQILAGVGIVAALMMSTVALLQSGRTTMTSGAMPVHRAAVANTVTPRPSSADVVIQHVMRGCHSMVVNGQMPMTPSAVIHLAAGSRLNVTDDDVMPHRLVQLAGPAAQFAGAAMDHMGARSTVTFPTAGTYSLSTKAGEDYSSGIKTVGEDNVLKIRVVVTA